MAEELKDSGTVTALSVIGLVFGLIGMLGSFIPCIGAIAFYIGIPAAIISAIALGIAYSQKAKNTFAIVALTISLIGVVISGWQFFSIMGAGIEAKKELERMSRPVMPAPSAPTAAIHAPAPGPKIEQLSSASSGGNKAEARKLFYDAYLPIVSSTDYTKVSKIFQDDKWMKKEILLTRGTLNFLQIETKAYDMFVFQHNKRFKRSNNCGKSMTQEWEPKELKTGSNEYWPRQVWPNTDNVCLQYIFEPYYEDTKLFLYLPKDFQEDFKIILKDAQIVN